MVQPKETNAAKLSTYDEFFNLFDILSHSNAWSGVARAIHDKESGR